MSNAPSRPPPSKPAGPPPSKPAGPPPSKPTATPPPAKPSPSKEVDEEEDEDEVDEDVTDGPWITAKAPVFDDDEEDEEPKARDIDSTVWSSRPVSNRVWEVDEAPENSEEQPIVINVLNPAVSAAYEIGKDFDFGVYSVVKQAINKKTKETVAIKVLNKEASPDFEAKKFQNEAKIIKSVAHANVVKFIESFETSDEIDIVLELVSTGNLLAKYDSGFRFSEADARKVAKQLFGVLAHLQSHGVVHGDIAPENLLLTAANDLKLAGFSNARFEKDLDSQEVMAAAAEFQSPELSQLKVCKESDLWSAGCVVFYLICGYSPFKDSNTVRRNMKIRQADFQFNEADWSKVSADAKDLISKLIVVDPKARLTASQALAHRWLA